MRKRRQEESDGIELIDLDRAPEKKQKRIRFRKRQKEQKLREKPRKRGSINREFAIITYGFLFLFLCMAGYFVYFVGYAGEDFINSPYNPRLSQLSEQIIRGDILAADGTVLATSEVDEQGNETRVYPKGNEYAHIVGFSANGMSGTELDANFQLLRSHSFFVEKIANELQDRKNQGDSVVTSLDTALTDAVYAGMGNYDGAAVALDPETGKILAMVSKPDFDPNTIAQNWSYYTQSGSSVLVNRAIQGQYPPGSTFKILTALAYLNEGGSMDDTFTCSGSYTYGDTTIHCYHNSVHGTQDFEQAFGNSCNSVFAEIGLSLNKTDMTRLAKRMLFNRTLPTELKNVKKSSFSLQGADSGLVMQTAIGQGNTLVTPIHMAMLASAIANDGVLMEPSVIDHTQNDGGTTVRRFLPVRYGIVFEEHEVSILQKLMRFVVTNGTGSKLYTDSYTAYGKTGTAEFSDNKSEAHSWFVGFAEKDEKKIAVAIVLERAGSGSEHAVPLARTMFDTYFR